MVRSSRGLGFGVVRGAGVCPVRAGGGVVRVVTCGVDRVVGPVAVFAGSAWFVFAVAVFESATSVFVLSVLAVATFALGVGEVAGVGDGVVCAAL